MLPQLQGARSGWASEARGAAFVVGLLSCSIIGTAAAELSQPQAFGRHEAGVRERGLDAGRVESSRAPNAPEPRVASAVVGGRPCLLEDVDGDHRVDRLRWLDAPRATVATPVRIHDEVAGVPRHGWRYERWGPESWLYIPITSAKDPGAGMESRGAHDPRLIASTLRSKAR